MAPENCCQCVIIVFKCLRHIENVSVVVKVVVFAMENIYKPTFQVIPKYYKANKIHPYGQMSVGLTLKYIVEI